MTDHPRRAFLRSASLGAAVVGAAAVVPAVPASAQASDHAASKPLHAGSFVVWVEDPRSGDVVVLVDENEIAHHDPALARRLSAVAATARNS